MGLVCNPVHPLLRVPMTKQRIRPSRRSSKQARLRLSPSAKIQVVAPRLRHKQQLLPSALAHRPLDKETQNQDLHHHSQLVRRHSPLRSATKMLQQNLLLGPLLSALLLPKLMRKRRISHQLPRVDSISAPVHPAPLLALRPLSRLGRPKRLLRTRLQQFPACRRLQALLDLQRQQ